MDTVYRKNKDAVKEELLARVRSKKDDSAFLEQLIADMVKKMGYSDAEVTGRPGDGGIDGIVYVDQLKTDFFQFQAKNWGRNVSTNEMKNFVASLSPQQKGLFVTTSRFESGVDRYLESKKHLNVILIDGDKLTELMVKYGVGVSVTAVYEQKGIDIDYFSE